MLKKFNYVLLCLCIYLFTPINYCSEELKPYRNELMSIVNEHCTIKQYNNPIHKYIYFKKLPGEEIGLCGVKRGGWKISIDPDFWRTANEDQKFELLAHELSHCILLKDHVDNQGNYMYYRLDPIPKEIVKQQFIENLRSKCGR